VQHYYDSLRDGLLQSCPGKYVLVEESRTANVFDSEKDAYCGATQPGVVFVTKVGDEDNYRRSKAKMKKNKPRVDINFGGSATPRLTIQGHFVSTLDGSCTPNHRIGYDSGADGGSIYDDSATNNVIAPCLPAFLKTQININGVEVDAVAAKMVLNGMQIPEVFEVDIETDWSAYGNEKNYDLEKVNKYNYYINRYSGMKDINCDLCKRSVETEEHLFTHECPKLKKN